MGTFYISSWLYAHAVLLRPDADPRLVSGITRSYVPGGFVCLIATLAALLSPAISLVFFSAIPLFYVIESSTFGVRSRRRRR